MEKATAMPLDEQKQTIEAEIVPLLHTAKNLVIKTKEQRDSAASFVKNLKDMREKIEERFHPTRNKQTAYKAYNDALETEKAFYGPIDEADKLTKAAIKAFDTQEAINAQREAERLEAERRDKETKASAKLEAKAEKELEKGNVAKAETLLDQAKNGQIVPSFAPPPPAVKKLVWKARVTNTFLLCKAIFAGLVPWSVIEIKQSALNDFARNHDGKTQIEGLEFYQESSGRI